MSEWKEVRLGDYIEFNPYRKLRKGDKAKKITMDMLIPYSKQIYDYIVEPYNGGAKFQNGDTIMARITPCLENGKHSYINILDKDEIAYGSTEYIVLCGKDDVTDNEFVYYFSHSPIFKNTAIKSMVGSSGRQRAQTDVLKDLVVNIPISVSEQQEIAGILSSLDAKIETNNKLNEKLEEMAQAIFKSWFVDFEPFKNKPFHETELGMIPEGWNVVSLDEIATFTNGLAMQKYRPNDNESYLPVLKIKELRQGFCDDTSEICTDNILGNYIAEDGDVIFSWSGTLLVDIWCGGKCGVNQHLFKVTSEKYNKWFYYFWIKRHLAEFIRIANDKAVTMGHIKRTHLTNALVVVPNKKLMQKADKIFNPIVNRIIEAKIESKHLASLRDTLLPRLMSGELKV